MNNYLKIFCVILSFIGKSKTAVIIDRYVKKGGFFDDFYPYNRYRCHTNTEYELSSYFTINYGWKPNYCIDLKRQIPYLFRKPLIRKDSNNNEMQYLTEIEYTKYEIYKELVNELKNRV